MIEREHMPDSKKHTALVTGASSGLGAEFARQLAAQGYNLILTARREQRLIELAGVLQSKHQITAETLTADLAQAEGIAKVAQRVAVQTDLEILVNNAGFGTKGHFAKVEPYKHDAMVQVHVNAAVLLSRAALPGMIANHRGYIINVASIAGLLPLRGVIYGSTKSFLIFFSQALESDLKGSGVHIQALCPGFTYTEFHDTPEHQGFDRKRIPGFLWLNAEQVVRESLATLPRNKVICIPGWQYRIIGALARNSFSSAIVLAIGRKLF
jgi:short-subunit dehydrogenase